ncbi:MAG: hypothetical protein IKV06_02925 [Alistipes sp.]|nr:hypothetical protein [Alistipes sp.]
MKKLLLLAVLALSITSCGVLMNTSTNRDFTVNTPYAVPVIVDLDISENKIMHTYVPPRSVRNAGAKNTVNTAIREALFANGDADVLVGPETQIKYNFIGQITSVVVTGYPAKYKNFRNLSEKEWYDNPYFQDRTTHSKKVINNR